MSIGISKKRLLRFIQRALYSPTYTVGFTGFYARCSRILVEFTIILEKYSTNDIAMKGFAYVFLMVLPCFYHYSRTNSAYSIVGNNVLQVFRRFFDSTRNGTDSTYCVYRSKTRYVLRNVLNPQCNIYRQLLTVWHGLLSLFVCKTSFRVTAETRDPLHFESRPRPETHQELQYRDNQKITLTRKEEVTKEYY